jgi:hypothetical protein
MAKLVCLFSILVLCGLSRFDPTPDIAGASLRLGFALVFAAALVTVVRKEFAELIG